MIQQLPPRDQTTTNYPYDSLTTFIVSLYTVRANGVYSFRRAFSSARPPLLSRGLLRRLVRRLVRPSKTLVEYMKTALFSPLFSNFHMRHFRLAPITF
jgi:hypothetical protein